MTKRADRTSVVIYMQDLVIEGDIALHMGSRLTDYLQSDKDFIAVTDAVVKYPDGKQKFQAPFLSINRNQVKLIVPQEGIAG